MIKYLFMLSIAAVMFVACGGDNGSSAKDDEIDSSSSSAIQSSSSDVKYSSSSVKSSSSSDVILSGGSAAVEESSSSSVVKSSSSSAKSSSSSDVILSGGSAAVEESSSSSVVKSSSSAAKSSSSAASSSSAKSSSSVKSSSSSAKSSSSSVKVSSSSYEPYDHTSDLGRSHFAVDPYKQFTDERNGRSYYYITIDGVDTSGNDASVTIMAENLNIGVMIDGEDVQENDDVIERFCYNNDTTKCDRYGGLYQWAEMMQLPSRCNIESCADSIPANQIHQGICPTGWRLMTYNDLYIALHAKNNTDGVKGLRSASFNGFNTTGLSLTGAGIREINGSFTQVQEAVFYFYPRESGKKPERSAFVSYVSALVEDEPRGNASDSKLYGTSVRCVMVE